MSSHKYFFAVLPPPALATRLVTLPARFAGGGAEPVCLMRPERQHVSLLGLTEDASPNAALAAQACRIVAAERWPMFQTAFNRLAVFGGRSLVLRGDEGVLGFDLLRAALHAALADASLMARRGRPYEAHLTLARGYEPRPDVLIEPVSWRADAFVLIHSSVGQTRYDIVARFPLRSAAAAVT